MQFLSLTESQAINRAPMSIHAKFLTRITIHAWRVLLHIAAENYTLVEDLDQIAVIKWIETDAQIRRAGGQAFLQWNSAEGRAENPPEPSFDDPIQDLVSPAQLSSHEKFLTRMIISAQATLCQIGDDLDLKIADLTSDRLIEWIAQYQQAESEDGIFLKS
jgi:hypothetical protein